MAAVMSHGARMGKTGAKMRLYAMWLFGGGDRSAKAVAGGPIARHIKARRAWYGSAVSAASRRCIVSCRNALSVRHVIARIYSGISLALASGVGFARNLLLYAASAAP